MKVLINLSENPSLKRSRNLGLAIKPFLEGLVTANLLYLATHHVPLLYKSGVRYQEEPPGTVEEFAGIPVILGRGWGDCIPEGTLLLKKSSSCSLGQYVPIQHVEPGNQIWGYDRFSIVQAIAPTGRKVIDCLHLRSGKFLKLSSKHLVYTPELERIRVTDVKPGDTLLRPGSIGVKVSNITRNVQTAECWDLTTDDHKVYLPEADVTVSNCDDLAPWRCAELRRSGEKAKIRLTWRQPVPGGRKEFHVQVRREDGRIEDPSLILGMNQ